MTWDEVKEFLGFLLPIALAMVLFVAMIVAFTSAAIWYECGYYARQTGSRTEFNIVAGCYVESGGKLIPYSEFKARAITNEDVAK